MRVEMKEASFWESIGNESVVCNLCSHHCRIHKDSVGICGVRKNADGKLYSLNHGKLVSSNLDPIEKKPLYHFLPGSRSYSIAATGCNLSCKWCQNWSVSQTSDRNHPDRFAYVEPEKVVSAAKRSGAKSISYTYTEPSVFYEYARDVSVLAKEAGIRNVWVSNGYMSEVMLNAYLPLLDAINIDIKAFDEKVHRSYTGARLEPILENCKRVKEAGVWLEVTTLLVPGVNDDEAQINGLAGFIAESLGTDTPWHVSRYFPQEQFREVAPTDPRSIAHVLEVGRKSGLKFVYAGNLGSGEDTNCPKCGSILLRRDSVWLLENKLRDGQCPHCGSEIAGVWS